MATTSTTTGRDGADAGDPTTVPLRRWAQILRRISDEIRTDHVTLTASGVAFHAFLALVPSIAAGVSIYGLVADPDRVRQLIGRMGAALPADVAALLQNQLDSIVSSNSGALGVGALIGIGSALWSASSGVGHLIEGINIAYDEDADDRPFWKRRGLAMALTVLFVSAVAAAAAIITLTAGLTGVFGVMLQVAGWLGVAAIFTVLLAVFFRYGPDRDEPRWVWVSPGAVFTVVAWTAASLAFSVYVRNFGSYNETYGSLGAMVVVLLWLFISALVVLLGAELNVEIERQVRDSRTTRRPRTRTGSG